MTWYNEVDPFAAQWLRNLASGGHVAPGPVETRGVEELDPDDVPDGQAHFFAGIGGWSLALRLAGVPDTAPVWTGSCPCQPFSTAGRRRGGGADRSRHASWDRVEWVRCRDPVRGELWRPVEPGAAPLVDGVPGRVGRLRAYGNAVVPQVAAAFVRAVMAEVAENGNAPGRGR